MEELRARLESERFPVEAAGCEIVLMEPRHAVCRMANRPEIQNELGNPMGGALFTLGDYTFALAANCEPDRFCITQSANVNYLRSAKGRMLTAEANCIHSGHSTCVYHVQIRDDNDSLLVQMTVTGFFLYPAESN